MVGLNMRITASKLRENIYNILDQILETGVPLEIERRERKLRIIPLEPPDRLNNLPRRPRFLRCDDNDIIHLDWSTEWRP